MIKLTDITVFPQSKGFRLSWADDKGYFGTFDFYKREDGEWEIDNECSGDSTILKALVAVLDFIPHRKDEDEK